MSLCREGLYTPPSLDGTLEYPFTGGGANWGSAAFDPSRNLLIAQVSNTAQRITLVPAPKAADRPTDAVPHGAEFAPMIGAPYTLTRQLVASPWGMLAAMDLGTGEIVWQRKVGSTEDLAPVALSLGTPISGGSAVTAGGLVFFGGAMENYLRAFDGETGDEPWKSRLPAGGQATPMT